ncbi:MAG: homoserine kinase [Chloroflexota bacterium]
MSSSSIIVRAPATSANLGAGFDCLGLALDLWNEVEGQPGELQADDTENLILRSARALYTHTGTPYPGFTLRCTNRIPFGRGLGSSSAAIASGLLLANRCLGDPLDSTALLELATRLEGHPDNVAACLLGGVRVTAVDDDGTVVGVAIPLGLALSVVVFVPEQSVPTTHARGVLPVSVPRADAVFNVGRVALLVAALASGRADLLSVGTQDRLHQPYRLPLFPTGAHLLAAALQAGALGAFVSGAGPSILALCADAQSADAVLHRLTEEAARRGEPGSAIPLALTQRGAHIVA